MRKKIFRSLLLISVLVLLLSSIISTAYLHTDFNREQAQKLSTQLELVADAVNALGTDYLAGVEDDTFRFTIVGSDGAVLYDTRADSAVMENHANRAEIIEALETGHGSSARYSATLTEQTFYEAVKLDNGNILRISTNELSFSGAILKVLPMNLLIGLIAIVGAFVLSSSIAANITEPLLNLDLEHPTENDAYEELAPVLTKIHRQHKQIREQVDTLRHKNEEFNQIISSMSEGLVLLDSNGDVLSMNTSARRIFSVEEKAEGVDFLILDRTPEIRQAILSQESREIVLPRNGQQYQFNISPIEADGKIVGTLILAFDITEKAFAERNRREFTANVSHELKTPLQGIIGSAELLESGLVKLEDTGRFVGNIKQEASRLVSLIDDIIRLSQLDEKTELAKETVDLSVLAQEVAQVLASAAAKKSIALHLSCDPICITGVRRYLYEIVYNLCDNAIRYNQEGGKVEVTVKQNGNNTLLSVTDTGIGIAPEHQPRIFERFYRVDKSHSKETGGTGLGLSIVKHAAQYLGAQVHLKSSLGKGTTITVIF